MLYTEFLGMLIYFGHELLCGFSTYYTRIMHNYSPGCHFLPVLSFQGFLVCENLFVKEVKDVKDELH